MKVAETWSAEFCIRVNIFKDFFSTSTTELFIFLMAQCLWLWELDSLIHVFDLILFAKEENICLWLKHPFAY